MLCEMFTSEIYQQFNNQGELVCFEADVSGSCHDVITFRAGKEWILLNNKHPWNERMSRKKGQ